MRTTATRLLLLRATILTATLLLTLISPPTGSWAVGGAEMEEIAKPPPAAQSLEKPLTDKNVTPEQEKEWAANPEELEEKFRHDQALKLQVAKEEKKQRDYVGAVHRNELRKKGAERREQILERPSPFMNVRVASAAEDEASGDESVFAGQEWKIFLGFALFAAFFLVSWRLLFGGKKQAA